MNTFSQTCLASSIAKFLLQLLSLSHCYVISQLDWVTSLILSYLQWLILAGGSRFQYRIFKWMKKWKNYLKEKADDDREVDTWN